MSQNGQRLNDAEHDENDAEGIDTHDDDTETPEGEQGSSDDDAGDDEYTPPEREKWEGVQKALKASRLEARELKKRVRDLEKGKEGAADEAGKQTADKYRPVLVKQAAKAALLEAGLVDPTPERVKKVLRLIDTEGVDVDDDGDVFGLDDQIQELKTDYPELFEVKQEKRQRVPRVSGADRKPAGAKQKSATELQVEQLLGRR